MVSVIVCGHKKIAYNNFLVYFEFGGFLMVFVLVVCGHKKLYSIFF